MPAGRPSSFTQEIADQICERLSTGEPLAKICTDDEMPGYSTVRRWEDENHQFRALSIRARIDGTHYMADDCIRIADDPMLEPADKRVRVDTRLRLIGKWNRKVYGDHTTVAGDPDAPLETRVDLSGLNPEQLRALANVKLPADR